MNEITASRTLVKSPPELWAECSDAESLARHLGEFGEIRITRREPETAVAWEGEEFSGTVQLEPSGWGTKVVMTARGEAAEVPSPATPADPSAESAPPGHGVASEPQSAAPSGVRGGLLARLLGRFVRPAASPSALGMPPGPPARSDATARAPESTDPTSELEQHLRTALESLGQAHRRPFSRG